MNEANPLGNMTEKILKTQALYGLIDYEPYVIMIALVLFVWLFYKLFLRDASEERHRSLRGHFRNLWRHTLWFSALFVAYKFVYQTEHLEWGITRALPYLGLLTSFWGMVVFVKTARLILLEYLFLGNMKTAVPVLIVNIFSLLLSVTLLLWGASYLFGIQVGPLLATSAAFSIILGLALQDTLGNLFAGISLQLDRSFEIGDWLEVVSGVQRMVGQVREVTWRATVLLGMTDETITVPNRFMANSQISNFKGGDQPFIRTQIFRLPLDADIEVAKTCLKESLADVPSVRSDIPPSVFINETTDSWVVLKVVYYIDSYGLQLRIGDKVLAAGLEHLKAKGIALGRQVYEIHEVDI